MWSVCVKSSNDAFRAVVESLVRSSNLLLVTHARADGDGLGVIAALERAAPAAGKKARVLVPDNVPQRYTFLFPETPPADAESFETLAGAADVILVADTCAFEQLDGIGDGLRKCREKTVVIDHHLTIDDVGAVQWSDTSAAATGVMALEILDALGWDITAEVAEPLFVAITSDTGWFRFANTDARTLRAAAKLLEAGARAGAIFTRLFQTDRPERLALLERVLRSLRLHHDGKLAMMKIRKLDFDETGARPDETENLINEAMRMEKVRAAVMLVENTGCVRVSLRSREGVDVAKIAQGFGGGGHARAAGCRVSDDIDTLAKRLVQAFQGALQKN